MGIAANSPRGFDLSAVRPGTRIRHSGHSFEKIPRKAMPGNGRRQWIHRSPNPEVKPEPADIRLFESDKAGNPTFALLGRVVVRESNVIGYIDPDNVLHMLGGAGLLEAEISAPEDASQLQGGAVAGEFV